MVKSVSRLPPPTGLNRWSALPGENSGYVPFHLELSDTEITVPPLLFRVYDEDVEVSPGYKTTYMAHFNAIHSYVQGKRLRVRACKECKKEGESGCNRCTSFEVEAVMFRESRLNKEPVRMKVPVRAPFSVRKDATASLHEFIVYSRLEAQAIILESKEEEKRFYRQYGQEEEFKLNGLQQLAYELAAAFDSCPPGHFEYLGRTCVATLALFKSPAAAGKTYALLDNLSDGDAIITPTAILAADITKKVHASGKSIAVMTYQKAVTAFLMGYRFRRVGLDEAFLFHQGAHIMAQCMALEVAVLTGDDEQIEAVQRMDKKNKWKWNRRTGCYYKVVEMRRNYRSKKAIVRAAGFLSGKPQRCMRASEGEGEIHFVRLPCSPKDLGGFRHYLPRDPRKNNEIIVDQVVTILQDSKDKVTSQDFQSVATAHEFQGSEADRVWAIIDSDTLGKKVGQSTNYVYVAITRARDSLYISAPEYLREIIAKASSDGKDYNGPELVDITHKYPDPVSADFEGPGSFEPKIDSVMQQPAQGEHDEDIVVASSSRLKKVTRRVTGFPALDGILARGQHMGRLMRRGKCIVCEGNSKLDPDYDFCGPCVQSILAGDVTTLEDDVADSQIRGCEEDDEDDELPIMREIIAPEWEVPNPYLDHQVNTDLCPAPAFRPVAIRSLPTSYDPDPLRPTEFVPPAQLVSIFDSPGGAISGSSLLFLPRALGTPTRPRTKPYSSVQRRPSGTQSVVSQATGGESQDVIPAVKVPTSPSATSSDVSEVIVYDSTAARPRPQKPERPREVEEAKKRALIPVIEAWTMFYRRRRAAFVHAIYAGKVLEYIERRRTQVSIPIDCPVKVDHRLLTACSSCGHVSGSRNVDETIVDDSPVSDPASLPAFETLTRIPSWARTQIDYPDVTKAYYNKIARAQRKAAGFAPSKSIVSMGAEERGNKGYCYLDAVPAKAKVIMKNSLGPKPTIARFRDAASAHDVEIRNVNLVWSGEHNVWHVAPKGELGTPLSSAMDSDRLGGNFVMGLPMGNVSTAFDGPRSTYTFETMQRAPSTRYLPSSWGGPESGITVGTLNSPGFIARIIDAAGARLQDVAQLIIHHGPTENLRVVSWTRGTLVVTRTSDAVEPFSDARRANILQHAMLLLRINERPACENTSDHAELADLKAEFGTTGDGEMVETRVSNAGYTLKQRLQWQRTMKQKARNEFKACHAALGQKDPYPDNEYPDVAFVPCSHDLSALPHRHCTVFEPGTETETACMEELRPQLVNHDDWHASAEDCLDVAHFSHSQVAARAEFGSCKEFCLHHHDEFIVGTVDVDMGGGETSQQKVDMCKARLGDELESHTVHGQLVDISESQRQFVTIVAGLKPIPTFVTEAEEVPEDGRALDGHQVMAKLRQDLKTVMWRDLLAFMEYSAAVQWRYEYHPATSSEGAPVLVVTEEGEEIEAPSDAIPIENRAKVVLEMVRMPMPLPQEFDSSDVVTLEYAKYLAADRRKMNTITMGYRQELEVAKKSHFKDRRTCAHFALQTDYPQPDGSVLSAHDVTILAEGGKMIDGVWVPRPSCRARCAHVHNDLASAEDCSRFLSAQGISTCSCSHHNFKSFECAEFATMYLEEHLEFAAGGYKVVGFDGGLFTKEDSVGRENFMRALKSFVANAPVLLGKLGNEMGGHGLDKCLRNVYNDSATPDLVKWSIDANTALHNDAMDSTAQGLAGIIADMHGESRVMSFFDQGCSHRGEDALGSVADGFSVLQAIRDAYVNAPVEKMAAATTALLNRWRKVGNTAGNKYGEIIAYVNSLPEHQSHACPKEKLTKWAHEDDSADDPCNQGCHLQSRFHDVDNWMGAGEQRNILQYVRHGQTWLDHDAFAAPNICRDWIKKKGGSLEMVDEHSIGFATLRRIMGSPGWKPQINKSAEEDFIALAGTVVGMFMFDENEKKALLDEIGHKCESIATCALPHGPICQDPSWHSHVCRPVIPSTPSCSKPHGPICPNPSVDHSHVCPSVSSCPDPSWHSHVCRPFVCPRPHGPICTHTSDELIIGHKCKPCAIHKASDLIENDVPSAAIARFNIQVETHKPSDLLTSHKCMPCTKEHEKHTPSELIANHVCASDPLSHAERSCQHRSHTYADCKKQPLLCHEPTHFTTNVKDGICLKCKQKDGFKGGGGCAQAEQIHAVAAESEYSRGRQEAQLAFDKSSAKVKAAYVRPTFSKPNFFEIGSGGKMRIGNQTFHVSKSVQLVAKVGEKDVIAKSHRFEGMWSDWVVTPFGIKTFYDNQSPKHQKEMVENFRMSKQEFEGAFLKNVKPDVHIRHVKRL